jgi:hypothetical protein
MKSAIPSRKPCGTKVVVDWNAVCTELMELGREVVANWEQGDLAFAVNRLRVAMDEIEHQTINCGVGNRSNSGNPALLRNTKVSS